MFKECYALEKIHGTSAHILWDGKEFKPFAGGESHARFIELFNFDTIGAILLNAGYANRPLTIYGEAYGGSQQGMSATYGPKLKFIVFDVCVDKDNWLSVPEADEFCKSLGLEFVPWVKISTDLKAIDAQRDAPSVQAIRNGMSMIVLDGADFNCPSGTIVEPYGTFGDRIANPKKREGIVLRPPIDLTKSTGVRIICKHKGDDFRETASPRVVADPAKLQVMADAEKIANEWVTVSRLLHVFDKIPHEPGYGMELMPKLMVAMIEDVTREAKGEIVDNEVVRKAIIKKTASMFKEYLKSKLK